MPTGRRGGGGGNRARPGEFGRKAARRRIEQKAYGVDGLGFLALQIRDRRSQRIDLRRGVLDVEAGGRRRFSAGPW